MVPSFRVRSFYLLDNAEAVSPGIRPFEAKMGEKGALQGKSKANRQGSQHQEVETGNDLGLWKSLNS